MYQAYGPLAILRVSMTQSNRSQKYELAFRFLKFQILETEWILRLLYDNLKTGNGNNLFGSKIM